MKVMVRFDWRTISTASFFLAGADESRKYTSSSRIIQVQSEIAKRCIELISLPEGRPAYVLDVGCGSGLSGQTLEEAGHVWCGCDISPSMLEVAREEVGPFALSPFWGR
jgi:18S rRNA (guanine1575-N7)-methyltransferase